MQGHRSLGAEMHVHAQLLYIIFSISFLSPLKKIHCKSIEILHIYVNESTIWLFTLMFSEKIAWVLDTRKNNLFSLQCIQNKLSFSHKSVLHLHVYPICKSPLENFGFGQLVRLTFIFFTFPIFSVELNKIQTRTCHFYVDILGKNYI